MKILLLLLCGLQFNTLAAAEYTVGVVPQFESKRLNAVWKPLLDEIATRTGVKLTLVSEKSIPVFEHAFKQGDYDFAYMNPWHAVIANETQGYLPIIKDGSRKLKGILVVNKDSGIDSVQQLDGEEVAFPAPNALGASLLMRADLKMIHGIDVKPVYVDTHPSVYLNVVLQTTLAGGGVNRTFKEQPENINNRLKVIYETRAVNSHPIVVHPRVPEEVKLKVAQAIIAISQDIKSAHLLEGIPIRKAVTANLDEYSILKDWGLREFYVEN